MAPRSGRGSGYARMTLSHRFRSFTIWASILCGAIISGTPLPAPCHTDGHLSAAVVDWEKGIVNARARASVEVSGAGRPADPSTGMPSMLGRARMEAGERAREGAMENLVLALKRLRVDADNTLGDLIGRDTYTQRKLTDALLHSVRLKRQPVDHFTSGCEARLRFGHIIASLPYQFPSQEFPVRDDSVLPTDYTGLIIDGRGLAVEPMLFPSVYDDNGLEIYGRLFVNGPDACRSGIASYCFDENQAMRNPKSGRRPYYTVAIRSLNGCPVLSGRDARRILAAGNTRNSLKKCNVIIIINRNSASAKR